MEPSPWNEPLNDPELNPVSASVTESPNSTSCAPIVILSFTNFALAIVVFAILALVIPRSLTLSVSELISTVELSTFTANSPAEVVSPSPSILLISNPKPLALTLSGFTLPPDVLSLVILTVKS